MIILKKDKQDMRNVALTKRIQILDSLKKKTSEPIEVMMISTFVSLIVLEIIFMVLYTTFSTFFSVFLFVSLVFTIVNFQFKFFSRNERAVKMFNKTREELDRIHNNKMYVADFYETYARELFVLKDEERIEEISQSLVLEILNEVRINTATKKLSNLDILETFVEKEMEQSFLELTIDNN